MPSGRDRGAGRPRLGGDGGLRERRKRRRAEFSRGRVTRRDLDPAASRQFERAGIGARVAREHEPRRHQVERVFELSEVLRDQRIGGRDRAGRRPDHHAGERKQRVLEAVAGKDESRRFRATDLARAGLSQCAAPARRRRNTSAPARRRLRRVRPKTPGPARLSPNARGGRSRNPDMAAAAGRCAPPRRRRAASRRSDRAGRTVVSAAASWRRRTWIPPSADFSRPYPFGDVRTCQKTRAYPSLRAKRSNPDLAAHLRYLSLDCFAGRSQ